MDTVAFARGDRDSSLKETKSNSGYPPPSLSCASCVARLIGLLNIAMLFKYGTAYIGGLRCHSHENRPSPHAPLYEPRYAPPRPAPSRTPRRQATEEFPDGRGPVEPHFTLGAMHIRALGEAK